MARGYFRVSRLKFPGPSTDSGVFGLGQGNENYVPVRRQTGGYRVRGLNSSAPIARSPSTDWGLLSRPVRHGMMHEDGFAAWSRFNVRYGLALAARQGQVLAQFASMVKVSKTPAETRSNMTEIDRMAKIVLEDTGRPVTDESMKGVLVGVA